MEMFHSREQGAVDQFMSGELSENAFLKKIDYAGKWPFPWLIKNQRVVLMVKLSNDIG